MGEGKGSTYGYEQAVACHRVGNNGEGGGTPGPRGTDSADPGGTGAKRVRFATCNSSALGDSDAAASSSEGVTSPRSVGMSEAEEEELPKLPEMSSWEETREVGESGPLPVPLGLSRMTASTCRKGGGEPSGVRGGRTPSGVRGGGTE